MTPQITLNRIKSLFVTGLLLFLTCFTISAQSDNEFLQKENLKILDIGNSYTNNATSYLDLLIKSNGMDISNMCLYKAIRGAGSFRHWYNIYYGTKSKDTTYSVWKVLGGLKANVSTGSSPDDDNTLFRSLLTNEQWDLIIIHQYSGYAPYYNKWIDNGDGGYLNKLLALIKELQPQAKIGFLLVHSYWDDYTGNNERSSYERWELIANSVKTLCENYPIDIVIPYGTAVENIRSSSLNNEYDMTPDGTHLSEGLGLYTAACCYYETLFMPRSGISVLGNKARKEVSISTDPNNTKFPGISVTDDNALTAQVAAVMATYKPYRCLNPEGEGFTLHYADDGKISLELNKYAVTFTANGEVIASYELEYGSDIVAPQAPDIPEYTFTGWSPDVDESVPDHDVTYSAQYTVSESIDSCFNDSTIVALFDIQGRRIPEPHRGLNIMRINDGSMHKVMVK